VAKRIEGEEDDEIAEEKAESVRVLADGERPP